MVGWIALHRNLVSHDLWLSEKFTRGQAWVDLLMLANHKDGFIYVRGIKVDIKRGQVGWSEVNLASRWKWSRGKVRSFLKQMENDQQIKQQNTSPINRISIVNYDRYQNIEHKNEQQIEQQIEQQTRQQNDTNNNDNNENNKNKKEKRSVFVPPTLEEVAAYFTENGYTREAAEKAFNYYQAGNWHDSKGNPVRNWKQKMHSVWFKPEYKIQKVAPAFGLAGFDPDKVR